MRFSELIPLTAALTNFALTFFVLSRDLRSTLNRVFLLWGGSLTVWNLGTFFMFSVESDGAARFWGRFLHFGVIFLPISLYHLSLLIAQIRVPRFIRWLYAWFGLLALSNLTDFFTAGVRDAGYAYYSVAGPGFWLFTVSYTLLTGATMYVLFRKQQIVQRVHRTRVISMLWANGILIFFGCNDILPILGITHYPVIDRPIFPFGSAAAIFYGIMVGYSVMQHHLLDIHVTLGKAAAHTVRLTFLFLIGLLQLLVLNVLVPNQFSTFTLGSSLVVLLSSGLIASIIFPRLFGQGEEGLEQRLLSERFGDRFEYHDRIRSFIQDMQFYTNTDLLLQDLDTLLVRTVRVKTYQIILLDETTHTFSIFRAHPEEGTRHLPNLRTNSSIFRLFAESNMPYLAFNLAYIMPGETELEREARELLAVFEPEFCFPFFSGEDPFGLLLIGEKSNSQPYTPNDLLLLTRLVKGLSLIVNQIRLKKRVLLAEELELLGRMSRGMAHDLNNLLTPVSTLLQMSDSEAGRRDAEELLPVCRRNVGTIEAYVREALFFSEHRSPQIHAAQLDRLIQRVVDLAEPKLKRRQVTARLKNVTPLTIEMDAVLIQRLLANLLSNAVDASPSGTEITIDLRTVAAPDGRREWARIRITDQGGGISREHLSRISAGYFTTKETGDEDRGFGLGLAICRKIVHLHDGNLNITSEEGRGTTVQVDLPLKNAVPAPASTPTEEVTA